MIPKARLLAAYKLMHDGAIALSYVEEAGIRIDEGRLAKTIVEVGQQIKRMEDEVQRSRMWKLWQRCYGRKAKITSRQQLGGVLFKEMNRQPKVLTKTGRPKVDESVIIDLGDRIPELLVWQRLEKFRKLHSTYLRGIEREVVDGYLHPVFNLHFVRTYRGSCDSPNFQNIPIRDPEIGALTRRCIIPREDHVLVEIDYGGQEVRIAACYHKDSTMLTYINDPTKDMHRDMAMECYCLTLEEVTKKCRFHAKNGFVFPEFYGSYYAQVAPDLWKAIAISELETAQGVPLMDHLEGKGIEDFQDFEEHIQRVEKRFWGERFPEYDQWKTDWYGKYLERGYFDMYTGFRCTGVFKRNDVINYPVQGPAFHCLLWALIRMVSWVRKRKLKSRVVGQIHDSLICDVHKSELDLFLAKAKQVMCVDLLREWRWIIVPLEIEAEVGEENWWDKKEIE